MRLNAYLARTGVASRRGADELIKTGRVRVNGVPRRAEHVRRGGRRRRSRRAPARAAASSPTSCSTSPPESSRPRATRTGGRPWSGSSSTRRASSRSAASTRTRPARSCSRTTATSRTGSRTPATRWTRSTRPRSRASPRTKRSPRSRPGSSSTTAATAPARARRLAPSRVELTIHEGRKHQVKRMLEAVGHPVTRLHRSRYAGLTARRASSPAQWRELTADEVAALRELTRRR